MRKKKNPPSVKANLTPELDTGLKIVTEKLGTTRAHVTLSALEYYLNNVHPGAMPRSSLEIFAKAKEDYLYNTTYRRYTDVLINVKSIPGYEQEILQFEQNIKNLNKKIEDKESELRNKKNKDIRNSLKKEIEDLQISLDLEKNYLADSKRRLEEAKSHHIS